jgi:hypothetical protein
VTDDVVEGEVAEDLPLGGSLMGHCQDAKDGVAWGMDPREVASLHLGCPATVWPTQHPDPARKGATYTLPGRRCPCACHTRPLL